MSHSAREPGRRGIHYCGRGRQEIPMRGTFRMSGELEFLSRLVVGGGLTRRDFLGRAAALGVTAISANALIASAARAQAAVKGGALKAGLVGGAATDSL